MNYAFLIDNRRCIGCHACSVACKVEHEVPLGVARTWVKYVEKGDVPGDAAHLPVTRCNHCDGRALRRDLPDHALSTSAATGSSTSTPSAASAARPACRAVRTTRSTSIPRTETAAKCNFCAHKVEVGLEPPVRHGLPDPGHRGRRPRRPASRGSCSMTGRDARCRCASPRRGRARRSSTSRPTRRRWCRRRRLRPRTTCGRRRPRCAALLAAALPLTDDAGRAAPHLRGARSSTGTRGAGRSRPICGRSRSPPGPSWCPRCRSLLEPWAKVVARSPPLRGPSLPGLHRRAAGGGPAAAAALPVDAHEAAVAVVAHPRVVRDRGLRRCSSASQALAALRTAALPTATMPSPALTAAAGRRHRGLHRVPVRAVEGPRPLAVAAAGAAPARAGADRRARRSSRPAGSCGCCRVNGLLVAGEVWGRHATEDARPGRAPDPGGPALHDRACSRAGHLLPLALLWAAPRRPAARRPASRCSASSSGSISTSRRPSRSPTHDDRAT